MKNLKKNLSLPHYRRFSLFNFYFGVTIFYYRCLKPNHERVSNQFDEELISEQLKYNGIVDIAYIRNQGWPFRMTFEDFITKYVLYILSLNSKNLIIFFNLNRYQVIAFPMSQDVKPVAKNCEVIIKELGIQEFAMGKTKVSFHFLNLIKIFIVIEQTESLIT